MAISTPDGLVAALGATTVQRRPWHKYNVNGSKQGYWHSYWLEKGRPVEGATPTVFGSGGALCDKATTGALKLVDPAGLNTLYLSHFDYACVAGTAQNTGGLVLLYDRLYACSGLVGNSVSVQTIVSMPALTRPDATGAGAEMWVETYATPGTSAQTLTITYTNQAGTGSRTATCAFPASANKGDAQPAILQAGDTGVQSVQSVQWGGSTGSAGNYGITLLRRVAELAIPHGNIFGVLDILLTALPTVDTGACLNFMQCPQVSAPFYLAGTAWVVEG